MTARVALITGGNKGLGYATAQRLAGAGTTVLLGARDAGRGNAAAGTLAAAGLDVQSIVLDVTDAASIDRCRRELHERFGRLDILVNNAGTGFFPAPPSTLRLDQLREVFETNFFAVFAVTHALLPLLRRSESGRVVNVSSGTASLFSQSNRQWIAYGIPVAAYSMSKTALNGLTVSFAAELAGTRIKINAVEPGFTRTDLTGHEGFTTPDVACAVIARYALIDDDGPTGGFFDINGPMPW